MKNDIVNNSQTVENIAYPFNLSNTKDVIIKRTEIGIDQ